MADRYISRDMAIARLTKVEVTEKLATMADAKRAIADMSAADVAPVVHGRWELLRKGDWTSVFVCSVCGRRETIAESESYNSQLKMPRKYPHCHCGARMDGKDGDGNETPDV